MTHETLTSCFIHVLTPPVPVVHASPSMLKRLVIFPFYVLFWLSLNYFFCSSVSLCLSLSVWRLLRAAAGHTTRCERGRVQPLTFLIGILTCGSPSGGPSKGWFDVFFFLPVPFCLCLLCLFVCLFVCVMEDVWSGPPCSSSPHGTIWKGSEVTELFFFSSAVLVWMNHFPIILTLLLPRYQFAWMHACSPLDRSYVSFSLMLKHRNRIYTITQTWKLCQNVEASIPIFKVSWHHSGSWKPLLEGKRFTVKCLTLNYMLPFKKWQWKVLNIFISRSVKIEVWQ